MTPRLSDLTCAYAPAEIFSFLLVQVPPMVRVRGVHNFQFGSGGQGFFRLRTSKESRRGHLLLALGTERKNRGQKTCRHSTIYFTPAICGFAAASHTMPAAGVPMQVAGVSDTCAFAGGRGRARSSKAVDA